MFKINELLQATKGKLIAGLPSLSVEGISIDSRTIKKNEAFVAIKGNKFDGHDFIEEAIKKGANCIMGEARLISDVTTDTADNTKRPILIETPDTTKALGDIARFNRRKFDIPVIAVTGSNGKTTTKEMIAWVLSKKYNVLKNEGTKNNHIGLPLALLNLNRRHDMAVLEIGTNHFGEIDYLAGICQPNIGIITNIGPVHLEFFKDLAGVFKEKYRLIENLKKPRIAVLNADDDLLRSRFARGVRPFILGFSIQKRSDFSASDIRYSQEKIEFRINSKYKFTLHTPGHYNIYNALAAIAVARLFGMEYSEISSSLAAFDFPQGRLKVIELNNVRFIDDTYNSNPVSLKQALDALDNLKTRGRKILVMGDMLELGSYKKLFHSKVGRRAVKVCDVFITVGELSKFSAKSARAARLNNKGIFTCDSCQEARDILFNKLFLRKGDVVLVKGSRAMRMEEVFKF